MQRMTLEHHVSMDGLSEGSGKGGVVKGGQRVAKAEGEENEYGGAVGGR